MTEPAERAGQQQPEAEPRPAVRAQPASRRRRRRRARRRRGRRRRSSQRRDVMTLARAGERPGPVSISRRRDRRQPLISVQALTQSSKPLHCHVGPAVDARRLRRLPVPDVLPERVVVGVEDVAVARGRLAQRARLRVARGLAEVLGDLDVRPRRDDVVEQHVGAVQVLRLGVDHPGVGPAGGALVGLDRPRPGRPGLGLQQVGDDLPGRADGRVAVAERVHLLRVVGPVLADHRLLLLQQVDRRLRTGCRRGRTGS